VRWMCLQNRFSSSACALGDTNGRMIMVRRIRMEDVACFVRFSSEGERGCFFQI
jgi:hypothetical protein